MRGAFNAVFVVAENSGELMFYGQGAGGRPTSSAIMGDLVSVARRLRAPVPQARTRSSAANLTALPIERAVTQYYIDMAVADREGVIAEIAQVLASHHVSIESMRQPGVVTVEGEVEDDATNGAKVQIVTHLASEKDLDATVAELRGLDVVKTVNSVLRVEVEK